MVPTAIRASLRLISNIGDAEISSNHQSVISTEIKPRLVSDSRWLESIDILSIVKCCLQTNIGSKRYDIVKELLDVLTITFNGLLLEEQQVEYAFGLIQ